MAKLDPLNELKGFQLQFERGHSMALFDAIAFCAERHIAMPEWVTKAFLERHRRVAEYEASLNDAFGYKIPPGKQLRGLRSSEFLAWKIYDRIEDKKYFENAPIGKVLFEKVGSEFRLSASLCEKLYYSTVERREELARVLSQEDD